MTTTNLHRLLRRQIKKAGLSPEELQRISPLLGAVNEAYRNFDKDYAHLENILEMSSQELFRVNKQLQDNVDTVSERLDRVVTNIQEVLFQTDLQGNWIYLNPAWEKLTGKKVEDSLGRSFEVFLPFIDEQGQELLKDFQKMDYERKEGIFCFRKGKMNRWFEVKIKRTYNKKGEPDGTIGTLVNISELKKAEQQLIKANQAKNEFLSIMSHEIRTPLNAVIGVSNLLFMNDPKEDQLENLNALKFSSEHLLSLINDILDFNKIESGKLEFDHSEFSLKTLLEGLKKSFNYAAEEKGIVFKVKQDSEIPNVLIGDSMRLAQILTNLVSNAIKFTKEGRVVLDVEMVEKKDEKIRLHFSVIDTGIGIAEENQKLVFERFTQAEKHTQRKFGGTGLGLAICKRLLELQGEQLQLTSRLGEGTTFFFDLTFDRSDRFDTDVPYYAKIQPSYSSLEHMKVLVAEDNRLNVLVVKQLFKKWDIDFDLAVNGLEALNMAATNDYVMILMDLQMPVMDGYDATVQIRRLEDKKRAGIPIVALTASAQNEILDRAMEVGMNGFIGKPFNPVDLYNTLKKYKLKSEA